MINLEIWVAIIASVTSLIVAIISLIATIINSRRSAQSAKELETLKHNYSQTNSIEQFTDEYLKESLLSLKTALQSIQLMKDEIQLVLSAVETSLDTETAIKRIKATRERLFNEYERCIAELDDVEKDAFHHAKNKAWEIELFLQSNLKDKEFVSLLTPEQKRQLHEFRNDLTEIQLTLRDSRSEKLAKRIYLHGR